MSRAPAKRSQGSKRGATPPPTSDSAISVCVRVRPPNQSELRDAVPVKIEGDSTIVVTGAKGPGEPFTFDRVFATNASQEEIYPNVGQRVVDNAMQGYNTCLFAYGQTGSGKTHTMLGAPGQEGIIPRICQDLFARLAEQARQPSDKGTFRSQVSLTYFEIYREDIRNLLQQTGQKIAEHKDLKIREHPKTGPYVEGITSQDVGSAGDIDRKMAEGNALRRTAATASNQTSSRSHAVCVLSLSQTWSKTSPEGKTTTTEALSARFNLIDLAGSEKSKKAQTSGDRLQEGIAINKSLTALGTVIGALAAKKPHVPFRDSKLTWLLSESLGGNSKTFMMANVSPAQSNVEETLSTLRYAQQCKKIKTRAKVNQAVDARKVQALQSEVDELKARLAQLGEQGSNSAPGQALKEGLVASQAMLDAMEEDWQGKMEAERLRVERETREQVMAEMEQNNSPKFLQLQAEVEQMRRKEAALQEGGGENLNRLNQQHEQLLERTKKEEQLKGEAQLRAKELKLQSEDSDAVVARSLWEGERQRMDIQAQLIESNDKVYGLNLKLQDREEKIEELTRENARLQEYNRWIRQQLDSVNGRQGQASPQAPSPMQQHPSPTHGSHSPPHSAPTQPRQQAPQGYQSTHHQQQGHSVVSGASQATLPAGHAPPPTRVAGVPTHASYTRQAPQASAPPPGQTHTHRAVSLSVDSLVAMGYSPAKSQEALSKFRDTESILGWLASNC